MSLYDHYSPREQEILRRRAQRVSQRSQESEAATRVEVLQVRMGGERYALPVEAVLAVYEHSDITPLPGAPEHIAGMVNLRGNLMVVLNPAAMLNIPASQGSDNHTLIIVTNQEFSVALCVQETGDVTAIDRDHLATPSGLVENVASTHLTGILPDGTSLLNVVSLLNDAALIVNQEPDQ
jgi:purine-binding chemotaxis protein CheW